MYMDVKHFYLNNNMYRYKFIMTQLSMIPQEFVEKYNLSEKAHNGYIYTRVTKGMYGIPQQIHVDLVLFPQIFDAKIINHQGKVY